MFYAVFGMAFGTYGQVAYGYHPSDYEPAMSLS